MQRGSRLMQQRAHPVRFIRVECSADGRSWRHGNLASRPRPVLVGETRARDRSRRLGSCRTSAHARRGESEDVVALIKSSLDVEACRSYLQTNAPALVARFDALVAAAVAESD